MQSVERFPLFWGGFWRGEVEARGGAARETGRGAMSSISDLDEQVGQHVMDSVRSCRFELELAESKVVGTVVNMCELVDFVNFENRLRTSLGLRSKNFSELEKRYKVHNRVQTAVP